MNAVVQENTYTVDAKGKKLGRVASSVAALLMGKNRTDAVRHIAAPVSVKIVNASKLVLDDRKKSDKTYQRYSGYPGGQKVQSMKKVIESKGHQELLRKAVHGMLPNNRLRAVRMKGLSIEA